MPSSLMGKIQRGKKQKPPRVLLYGTPGIGKSTLGSNAPNPIFIQTEDGLDEIDCCRFPMGDPDDALPGEEVRTLAKDFGEVTSALRTLATEEHDFETVVIDSLDWLEQLVWKQTCDRFGAPNIEKVDGGFAKGYTHCLEQWRDILGLLDQLRNRGMIVLLLAHAKIEKFEDPESSPYDRYTPRLHKHAVALFVEWCDAVIFATSKIRTKTEDSGFNKKRTTAVAVGKDGGERILRCVGGPACLAKNRFGITEELPLSWEAFMEALSSKQEGN